MIEFANENMLWLLLLIPAAILLYSVYVKWRRVRLRNIGTPYILSEVITGADTHNGLYKFLLQLVIFGLIVLAFAKPQVASGPVKKAASGGDVVICLDVSNSMLAEDIRPNRLARARQATGSFIRQLGNEQIGLVVFAGEAYIQVPLTSDKAATLMLLNTITPGDVTNQGTAVADAISLAVRTFGSEANERGRKTIILVSDGEDHEGGAVEEAKLAAAQGIVIYTVGVGEPSGVPVPVYEDGILAGYKKDDQGNTVLTTLNPGFLTSIAETTGGKFFLSSNINTALQRVKKELSGQKNGGDVITYHSQVEEQFQWFAGFALLLLVVERMIPYRGNKRKFVDWLSGLKS